MRNERPGGPAPAGLSPADIVLSLQSFSVAGAVDPNPTSGCITNTCPDVSPCSNACATAPEAGCISAGGTCGICPPTEASIG